MKLWSMASVVRSLGVVAERVAVLGAGSWGTTVANVLAATHDVALWARSRAIADEVATRHTNSTYLGSHRLAASIRATSELAEALAGATVVVVAVPSHGVRAVLDGTAPAAEVVVSLAKGLEQETHKRVSEVIAECWDPPHIAVLTGPNLAGEVLDGHPTASVVACEDAEVCRFLQSFFTTPALRIYTNPDVVGCEIAGVAKNVMAIAIGMASGLGLGDNTRAALITRSLAEISRLGEALGGRRQTFSGLAGLGDLVATSLSAKSRNFSVGLALGEGVPIERILAATRMVAEGVKSCSPVVALAEQHGVDLPVAREVVAVVKNGSSPRESLARLMARAMRSEFDDP